MIYIQGINLKIVLNIKIPGKILSGIFFDPSVQIVILYLSHHIDLSKFYFHDTNMVHF